MRDKIHFANLESVLWIPRPRNYVEVLDMRDVAHSRKPNNVFRNRLLELGTNQSCSLDAKSLKRRLSLSVVLMKPSNHWVGVSDTLKSTMVCRTVIVTCRFLSPQQGLDFLQNDIAACAQIGLIDHVEIARWTSAPCVAWPRTLGSYRKLSGSLRRFLMEIKLKTAYKLLWVSRSEWINNTISMHEISDVIIRIRFDSIRNISMIWYLRKYGVALKEGREETLGYSSGSATNTGMWLQVYKKPWLEFLPATKRQNVYIFNNFTKHNNSWKIVMKITVVPW